MALEQRNLLDSIQSTLLLGAGPSGVAPSTYAAISRSTLGHLDPYFIEIMNEIKRMLKELMGTDNEVTVPLSGTGSIGMEASFVNVVERGDKVLVLENGVFGRRMVDVAGRLGAEVTQLSFKWGTTVDPDAVKDALKAQKYKIVAIVHAETSTGVCNPVEEIGKIVNESGALYIVDTVTSLGGIPVDIDKWHADICYSGTQKCLSCPPGLAPISLSPRAMQAVASRETKVPNWYLDLNMLTQYWGGAKRVYHHTAPINMVYALYQALYNIFDEGVENVFARHQAAHKALAAGLDKLGLEFLVDAAYRLPELNTIVVPDDIDEALLRKRLLEEHHIEVSSGLGDLAGKVIRIGLMGYNATVYNAERVIGAIENCLERSKKS